MDIAKSVLQKLRNKAQKTGVSFQLILQLFCQEEFLRRLGYSKYQDNLVLKGGLLLYLITQFESRPTMDQEAIFETINNRRRRYEKDTLEKVDKEVLIESDYDEEVIKVKKCTSCGSSYEIEDIFPLDDLYTYSDDFLDQYDLRTVFIK